MYRENIVYVEFSIILTKRSLAGYSPKGHKGPDMTGHKAQSVTGIQLGILENIPHGKAGTLVSCL